jgi:hypothetical protein
MVTSASIAVAFDKKGLVLDTDKSGNFKGTNISKDADLGHAVSHYQDVKMHYGNIAQSIDQYNNIVREKLLGKTDIVDKKGNRFEAQTGQIRSGVDSSGKALQKDPYGRFLGTNVKAGQNADSVAGTRIHTPGVLEKQRPKLYEAVKNMSDPAASANKNDLYVFAQAASREDPHLRASILEQAKATDKSARQQSKVLNNYAKSVSDPLSQIPPDKRASSPETVLGTLSIGKGADPATKFLGSMGLSSQYDPNRFKVLAGSGTWEKGQQTTSYNPTRGEDRRNLDILGTSMLTLGLANTDKWKDKRNAPLFNAAASGNSRATKKALGKVLKRLGEEKEK